MRAAVTVASIAFSLIIGQGLPATADGTLVRGEIVKVSPDTGKLTIKHEPIKKFDMDAMTMVFRAADPEMLKTVKPGDKVQFHPDKVDGQFTVTRIEIAKK